MRTTSKPSLPLRLIGLILLVGAPGIACSGGSTASDAGGGKGGDLLAGASAPRPQGSPESVTFSTRGGLSASVDAMPGEVIVAARPSAFDAASAAIKARVGAKILGGLPAFGVVLAKVEPADEAAFIAEMRDLEGVMDAFPNFMVTGACIGGVPPGVTTVAADEPTPIDFPSVAAQLDLFTGDIVSSDGPTPCVSHGEVVNCFMDGRFSGKPHMDVTQINLSGSAVQGMPTEYSFVFNVARLIQGAKNRPGPAVINVSLGPSPESQEAYTLFFYQMYEMLAVLSPETRNRISIVVSSGNDGIPIGPALAAARAVAATVDPDAAKHVVVVGGTELDEDGNPIRNNSDVLDDLLCAPAENQSCKLSATRDSGPVSGTSFSAPQVTELLARLGAQSRYDALGAAGLIQAVHDAARCENDAPVCSCKKIPTLKAAEDAANARLAGMGGGGGSGGDSAGSGGTGGTGNSAGTGGSGGGGLDGGPGGTSGTGGTGGTGTSGVTPDAGASGMQCCCRFEAEHYCGSRYDPCWTCVETPAALGGDYLCGSTCNSPIEDQCVTTCP